MQWNPLNKTELALWCRTGESDVSPQMDAVNMNTNSHTPAPALARWGEVGSGRRPDIRCVGSTSTRDTGLLPANVSSGLHFLAQVSAPRRELIQFTLLSCQKAFHQAWSTLPLPVSFFMLENHLGLLHHNVCTSMSLCPHQFPNQTDACEYLRH